MSYLIDDVARSLASPKPRREALKLVGRMLAGGLLGAVALRQRAQAANCGSLTCSGSQKCCSKCWRNASAQPSSFQDCASSPACR